MSSLERCYLQTITPEAPLNDKVVSRNKPDKTQRNICLLCALFEVKSYSL
jgi:hypothetical protein